jgi:hypothetical protein
MAFRMDFSKLARCGAKARSNGGKPCRQATMSNGKCHWHGGKAHIKHGSYTHETKMIRTWQRTLLRDSRQMLIALQGHINQQKIIQ